MALGLHDRSYQVEFFTYFPENHYQVKLDEAGIPVHTHQKKYRYSLSPIKALRSLIQNQDFDIVVSFLDTPNIYNEIACLGLLPIKTVVSERFMYPPGKLTTKFRLLQQFHRLADAITVNSHHQRVRMEREFPWMAKKLNTIYNGYDLDSFKPELIKSTRFEKLSLLAISSVAYKKNSINLAKALVICLNNLDIEVTVDWVGVNFVAGEGNRPKEETDIFLANHGISHLWRWLGERTDIQKLLVNHDALIHPSFFEGLPNVVCEALACGKPVLVSDVCDHSLLVQEGVSGHLFNPESPEDIARAIHQFSCKTPQQQTEMGSAARKFAENNLSLNRYIHEYEELFGSLLEGSI